MTERTADHCRSANLLSGVALTITRPIRRARRITFSFDLFRISCRRNGGVAKSLFPSSTCWTGSALNIADVSVENQPINSIHIYAIKAGRRALLFA